MTTSNSNNKFYTSRSAIEAYQKCPRYRYLRYLYKGRGLQPNGSNIYLSTGTAIHKGVEFITTSMKKFPTLPVDSKTVEGAVEVALAEYVKIVTPESLTSNKISTTEAKTFAFHEQKAIVEALVRCWGWIEGPTLQERFKVIGSELDVANKLVSISNLNVPVILESKTDVLLQERSTGYLYTYSLKSAKKWSSLLDKQYRHDLQGVTEIWGTEKWCRRQNKARLNKGLSKKYQDKVMGVRFCYLIKGDTKEKEDYQTGEGTGVWFTYNPFIRGYRNFSARAGGTQFAHSWYSDHPTNKSGKTSLGKGWEPFNVWESYKGGVKLWMERILKGEIQPDYSNLGVREIFKQHVITPQEVYRKEDDIVTTIEEIKAIEWEVYMKSISDPSLTLPLFPRNRQACFYPTECEMTPICWGDTHKGGAEGIEEMMEQGWFKWRKPHHKRELIQINEKSN